MKNYLNSFLIILGTLVGTQNILAKPKVGKKVYKEDQIILQIELPKQKLSKKTGQKDYEGQILQKAELLKQKLGKLMLAQSSLLKKKADLLMSSSKSYKEEYIKKQQTELKEAEKAYFQEFPSTFEDLNALFGYHTKGDLKQWPEKEGPGPLYWHINHHYIDCFFELSRIPQTALYGRLINIAREGKWHADNISCFQHRLRKLVLQDLHYFINFLISKDDGTIRAFWFFYFDGPHPPKTIPESLKEVKKINADLYTLMQKALHETHKGACKGH